MQIQDAGEVELAVAALELGDVGDPALVDASAVKSRPIRSGAGAVLASAAAPLLAAVNADEAALGHDPSHPLAADRRRFRCWSWPSDPRRPVGALGRVVDLEDLVRQSTSAR